MVAFTARSTLESRVFILDDLCCGQRGTAQVARLFKIKPIEIEPIKRPNEVIILDGLVLARDLKRLIELEDDFRNIVCVGRGGVVAYGLLRQTGAGSTCAGEIGVERTYLNGKPQVSITRLPKLDLTDARKRYLLLDDVIASGQTINAVARQTGLKEAATLVLSTQARGEYRTKDSSTVKDLDTAYFARGANYSRGFPAIFSLRFLRKAVGTIDYDTYLQKYVGNNLPTLKAILRPNTEKLVGLDALFGAEQQNA